jgi:peptide deformylase
MILKVARIGHPVIRSAARDVPSEVLASPEFQHLVDDMVDTMHEYDGVGLAGPQVHVGLRVAVLEVPASDERARAAVPLTILVNPVVVPRWKRLRLDALDRQGQPYTVEADGFFARVIQHECDHLEGGVYLDRMEGMRSLSFLREFERFVAPPEDE